MGNYDQGLILVPSPIEDESQISIEAANLLKKITDQDIILVEDLKPARRRWIHWGLGREWIEKFEQYNEHNHQVKKLEVLEWLKAGKRVFLLSDCGLPAFCDPGQDLVDLCHKNKIKVTSTPMANSVILALALSGFPHHKFWFEGFVSREESEKRIQLINMLNSKYPVILMDTAYRLKKLLNEILQIEQDQKKSKTYFLAMDLNKDSQILIRGKMTELIAIATEKQEFILISSL